MVEAKKELLLQITDLIQQARPNGLRVRHITRGVWELTIDADNLCRTRSFRNKRDAQGGRSPRLRATPNAEARSLT